MTTKNYYIQSGEEVLCCSVDNYLSRKRNTLLSIHGAGTSDRNTIKYLLPTFKEYFKRSIRFDCSGHGNSTGLITSSSLEKRYREACSVVKYFNVMKDVTLIGTSMGGYIATCLLNDIEVNNLILFCPAAYSVDAWDVPFDCGFTNIIRSEKSYLKTDIFKRINSFSGNVLLIIGKEDRIIPSEVTALYQTAFKNCNYIDYLFIESCPHPIHKWAIQNPDRESILTNKINDFLIRVK